MSESELKINESGNKQLVCFYDPALKDWDQVISQALKKHNLKVGEVGILCLPQKQKRGNDGGNR